MADTNIRKVLTREAALFFGLIFVGLIIVPAGIYLVGQNVFGAYAGYGYGDFFGTLSGDIRAGAPAAWFIMLSPYLALQLLRLTGLGWRIASKADHS